MYKIDSMNPIGECEITLTLKRAVIGTLPVKVVVYLTASSFHFLNMERFKNLNKERYL
jgi:hypothetical protein